MATEEYHLRCADKTEEHLDDDRKQGSSDGYLDTESAASTRGEDAAEDLSGTEEPIHISKPIFARAGLFYGAKVRICTNFASLESRSRL